jgi:hypothetical protein
MKSITEFALHTLTKGLADKAAMTAEGKSPEDTAAALGTSFKYEGDKLKHFVAALDVAGANQENLSRVLVVQVNEGETAPAKSVKVEEFHYVPEFKSAPRPITMSRTDPKGGGGKKTGGGGGKDGRPKTSPWGLTPEEKAAKNKGGQKGAKPTT